MPLLEATARVMVIEFCAGSTVWRHLPDPMDIEAGEATYQLEPPPGADIALVVSCKIDGDLVEQVSIDDLDATMPTWATEQGDPTCFTQVDTETITLAKVPASDITAGLVTILALQPRRSSIGFPGWIAAQYLDVIASGIIARLMKMPGRPWSHPADSLMYQLKFDQAVAAARVSVSRGLGRGQLRTTSQH